MATVAYCLAALGLLLGFVGSKYYWASRAALWSLPLATPAGLGAVALGAIALRAGDRQNGGLAMALGVSTTVFGYIWPGLIALVAYG